MSICSRDTYDNFVGQIEDKNKTEMESIKSRIKDLKAKIKNEDETGAKVLPELWDEIEKAKEELREIKRAYIDSGYEYVMTRSEKIKEQFLADLQGLNHFDVWKRDKSHTAMWSMAVESSKVRGTWIMMESDKRAVTAERGEFCVDRKELVDTLKSLDMDEWKIHTDGPIVLDRDSWSVELTYSNEKQKKYNGTKDYPFGYHHLIEKLSEWVREHGYKKLSLKENFKK